MCYVYAMTSPAYSAAVRRAWVAYSTPLEGCVAHLYRDIRGGVTTAIGLLVDSPSAAAALAWRRQDGRLASAEEDGREWARVRALPAAHLDSYYARGAYLYLDDSEIQRVTLTKLDADGDVLAGYWDDPRASFAAFPPEAQAALLSLAWAVGAGSSSHGLTGPEWPHLQTAIDAQDWRAAAAAGQLRWSDDPGVRPRDLTVSVLFLQAAGASYEEARATWPQGPVAETAEQALAPLLEAIAADRAEAEPTLETGS